jgi:hypothetical protein
MSSDERVTDEFEKVPKDVVAAQSMWRDPGRSGEVSIVVAVVTAKSRTKHLPIFVHSFTVKLTCPACFSIKMNNRGN